VDGASRFLTPELLPMRYYFNIKDGKTMLDDEGLEFANLEAVRNEGLLSSADMLKALTGDHFWSGDPWVLWVSDQPNGEGNTVLTLTFSANLAA
jgi:hypothetical protein